MNDLHDSSANNKNKSNELFLSILRAANLTSRQTISPRTTPGPAPLSSAQQQMWFLNQVAPDSPVYNTYRAFCLKGHADVPFLKACFKEIVQRHEILRTTFTVVDETPLQIAQSQSDYDFSFLDLTDDRDRPEVQTSIEISREIYDFMGAAARRTFDLTKGPCFRVALCRQNPEVHYLIVVMPHIVCDGWSLSVLFKELSTLYEAFADGQTSFLAELPVQFSDYSVWQQDWLQGSASAAHAEYWTKQLEGCSKSPCLPTDYPRPMNRNFVGASESFQLTNSLTDSLKNFSGREGATLFMTLVAAFKVLLCRYSGQEDIILGTPIANRNHGENQGMIGCFVNTLALRTNLSGNPSFQQLLARVKRVILDGFAHQEFPFQKVIEKLQLERDSSFSPLFQVAIVLQNTPSLVLRFSELTFTPVTLTNNTAKYDLSLIFEETSSGLSGTLEYAADLFRPDTIKRLAGHFQTLLEGIVNEPDLPISELPLLTEAERRQLLVEWNDTKTAYPREQCVHQLFEKQAELSPDAAAVIYDACSLTYEELNRRANQLAHFLLAHGVSSGSFVGICMERSVEMIVGLLAILKAGGTYVPLDPEYPRQRLHFMMKDAGITVLLTQAALVEGFSGMDLLCVDCSLNEILFTLKNTENPNLTSNPGDLAYVIYTSGSTGTPKGVCVPHRAVNRLVRETNYIDLRASDNVAQASNASFDAATFEIWGALLNGARLVGISKYTLLSASSLEEHIRSHKITTIFLTTALFNEIARERPDIFQPLRHVLFGGEAVTPKWVQSVLAAGPPARFIHVYGPTECTTFATWHLVEQGADKTGTIPIGRPVSNTTAYILDAQRQPVPVGVPGELYLGGDGLADRYLNRPELTAEKFIPNRFCAQPGEKLYNTGDIVRYTSAGNIEFIGRRDQQVKIRGLRIELGEIEAALSAHPNIQSSVVVVNRDKTAHDQLHAYVVLGDDLLSARDIQLFLAERLPHYMIPANMISLDVLPLTSNGKVDRKALPVSAEASFTHNNNNETHNDISESLSIIWSQILNVEQVGFHDDFFDLGGHSLQAMQLIAQIRRYLQVELSFREIFDHPTIAGLAEVIASKS